MKAMSRIRFLARKGLPLHGYNEDITSLGGNLYHRCCFKLKILPKVTERLKKKKDYISPGLINEFKCVKQWYSKW